MRIAVLALVVGCSFVAVRGPSDTSTAIRPDCTTDYGVAVADAAAAALFLGLGATGVYEIASCRGAGPDGNSCAAAGLMVFAPVGLVYTIGSLWGFDHVHQCRDAIERADSR